MSESGQVGVGSADDLLRTKGSQAIHLTGKQGAVTIHDCDVAVHACKMSEAMSAATGSNKIQVTTLTNQIWEIPKHRGNMVACSKEYVAYILQMKNGNMLRVIQHSTSSRVLLKCTVSDVICDIAFLHVDSNMLACVDGGGNLHVWDLDLTKHSIAAAQPDALKLIVQRSLTADNEEHRLTWCPNVSQEDGDHDEPTHILALSHGTTIEAVDLHVLFKNFPPGTAVPSSRVDEGIVTIPNAHQKAITDLSMSPDGLVLASTSEDGHLKFWSIDWESKTHKCLHDYVPHNGAPVTRLIFCDDHVNHDSSTQFWRFLITAANNSSVVKLWCTITWNCLQTISFLPPPIEPDEHHPHIHLSLDHTAKYLLAVDSRRPALYIFQLLQDGEEGNASFVSLTEYPLTQPILSFVILGCKPLPIEGESEDELDTSSMAVTKFDSRRSGVLLNLHCVQTKSMQEMKVRFEPPDVTGIPSSESIPLIQDGLTPPELQTSSITQSTEQPSLLLPTHFPSVPEVVPAPMPVKLFTPSELMSPGSVAQSPGLPTFSQVVPSKTTSLLYPHSVMTTTFGSSVLSQTASAESSGLWLSTASQEKPAAEDLPQDSDGTGEEDTELEVAEAHKRFMELIKPDQSIAKEEGAASNPISYEQFVQALDDKRELSPIPKATKHQKLPRGEGEGQSISADEETESAGAEVVVSQELSGEELGDTPAPPLLANEERGGVQGGDDEEDEQWPDLVGVPQAKSVQLLVSDETGEERLPRVMERGVDSTIPGEADIPRDIPQSPSPVLNHSNVPQDQEVAEEDAMTVHGEALNQSGNQLSLEGGPASSQSQYSAETAVKCDEPELLEVPEAASVVTKKKRRRKSKPKNSSLLLEAINNQSDGEPASVSSETLDASSIAELHHMVAKQQEEIKELRELYSRSVASLQQQLNGISTPILQELRAMSFDQQQRYDRLSRDNAQDKQKQDKFLNTLSQNVTSTVSSKLDKLVKQEMKNTVLPAVTAAVEQKSSVAANVAVQEAVRGALASKELVDTLAASLSHIVQRVVSSSYDQAFRSVVLPSFEKACQEMFRQIDEAFRAGTTDYLSQLQRQRHQDPTLQQIATTVYGLQSHVTQLSASNSPLVQLLQSAVHQELHPLSQQLQQSFGDTMKKELGAALEKHTTALNAQLKAEVGGALERHTSVLNAQQKVQEEKKKREEEIQQLLASGQLNRAFEVALSTSDLSVVTFVCQQVTPDEVFSSASCPLTQPVLLSLIQQLSVNLSDNLDLKIGYLESSILALDPNSDTAKNYMTPVLSGLSKGLAALEKSIQSNPDSVGLTKQVRRLRIIAERLCQPIGR